MDLSSDSLSVNSCSSSFSINSSMSIVSSDSDDDGLTFDSNTAASESDSDSASDCPSPELFDDPNDPLSQPLYAGADITLRETYLLLMQHSVCYSLTKQAFSDLLKVVGTLLPSKSMVSYYKLRKYFLDMYLNVGFTKRYCCAVCHSALLTKETTCSSGCNSTPVEFLTIFLESQLKKKLEGEYLLAKCTFARDRELPSLSVHKVQLLKNQMFTLFPSNWSSLVTGKFDEEAFLQLLWDQLWHHLVCSSIHGITHFFSVYHLEKWLFMSCLKSTLTPTSKGCSSLVQPAGFAITLLQRWAEKTSKMANTG